MEDESRCEPALPVDPAQESNNNLIHMLEKKFLEKSQVKKYRVFCI